MTNSFRVPAAAALTALAAQQAFAQTPINAPGAMQPSTGTGLWHVMSMYREIGSDPTSNVESGKEYILLSQVAYGLTSQFSVQFDAPFMYRDLNLGPGSRGGGDDHESGVGDMTLLAKYRIFQDDPAPTDTTRFSLIGGLQVPGMGGVDSRMDSSNDAWDPIIGAVFSTVRGRHGFNLDALWEFYTGDNDDDSDSLRYDGSYLYRLAPDRFGAQDRGALYAVAELNGLYGANGDHEIFLSPGIMYESFKYTLDATVMIPVYQDVDFRAETEFVVGVGLRVSF